MGILNIRDKDGKFVSIPAINGKSAYEQAKEGGYKGTEKEFVSLLNGLTGSYTPENHTHTKSQITDFPSSMPASDVYSWAKQPNKPSYTASDVGLGNVNNTSDMDKPVSNAQAQAIYEARAIAENADGVLSLHMGSKSNPHGVTASQVGAATTFAKTVQVSNTTWTLTNGTYIQTITCDGLLSTDIPIVDVCTNNSLDDNKLFIEAWGHIIRAVANNNSITLYTDGELPNVSFSMNIKVVR